MNPFTAMKFSSLSLLFGLHLSSKAPAFILPDPSCHRGRIKGQRRTILRPRRPSDILSLLSDSNVENTSTVELTKASQQRARIQKSPSSPLSVPSKFVWEHKWVPNGERRERLKTLIKELQKAHLTQAPDRAQQQDVRKFLEEGMEILVQWAQLGEGDKCQAAADEMLRACSTSTTSTLEYYETQVKLLRRVLHAYYNQLQRVTWNGKTKKPKFQLDRRELTIGQQVLEKADKILQRMEDLSRECRRRAKEESNKLLLPLMDANDYHPLILAYNQIGRAIPALYTLRRLTDLFESSSYLPRLAPTTSDYVAVMKAIFNYQDTQDWVDRMGDKISRTEMVSALCKECAMYARKFPELLKTNIILYNTALDGWSKMLKPLSGKTKLFVNQQQHEQNEKIATEVSELVQFLKEDGLSPNAKTYISMIYTHAKTGKLEKGMEAVQSLMAYTRTQAAEARGHVDSRALRMLANALRRDMEAVDDEVTRVQFAENIDHTIDYLWELHENGYHDVKPDVFLYTTAVDAWALAQSSQSALRAQMLVDDLKARHEVTGEPDLKPDIAIYNALIKAIARQPGLVEAAEKAGVIVRSLEEDDTIEPDVFTYNGLIQACLASPHDITKAEQTLGRMILTGMPIPNESSFRSVIHALLEIPGGTSRAEALLDRMEERYLPKASLYERIIFSWCEQVGMADRARRLLERMEQLFAEQDRSESLRPNRALYGAVIRALEDQGDTLSAEEVRTRRDAAYGDVIINEKLRSNSQVFALLKEVDANLSGETPSGNTYNFNYVLSLLADSGKIWTGLRAEDVLNYMLELTFKRKNIEAAPDIVTFNSVIACWARSNHPLATEKAPGVLRKLEELHDMGLLEDVVADRVTYNTLMSVYAKSYENEGSARKAQECFDKLVHLYEQTGDKRYMPDVVSYSTLLSAWARSREVGTAKRAEDILVKMHEAHVSDPINNPQPDTVCFNEVLYAWARSNEANADRRAEMVLELMKEMDRNGDSKVVPNTRTYNIVLLALANSPKKDSPIRAMKLLDDMNKISNAKPDLVSYNTAISTFLKQGSVNGALQMLEELFVRNDVVLDSKFFASLINSIAEAGPSDAPVIAEGIVLDLLEKRKWKVDVEVFNALINCWGRSGTTDAARRAYDILQDMIDGKYGAEPNVVTFTSVINIWAKSGAPDSAERAEEVLNQIISFKGVEPNVQTYTATIQAMARSNYRDKARRAQEILNLMKDDFSRGNRDAEPTVFAYNAVLNAAEYTVGNEADLEQAFRVACETFDQVRSSDTLKPDHVTYGTFMGVISQLMPESDIRNDMIQLVFRRCCVDGQLAPVVMKKFREAADSQQFLQLMGKVVEDNLPQEWTCNVRGARQYI